MVQNSKYNESSFCFKKIEGKRLPKISLYYSKLFLLYFLEDTILKYSEAWPYGLFSSGCLWWSSSEQSYMHNLTSLKKLRRCQLIKKMVSDSRNQQMCPPHPDSTSPPSPTQLGKIFFTYRPYICRYDNLGWVMFLIYNMYVCRYWDVSLFTYFPSEIKYACPDIENWRTQSLFGSVW